MAQRTLRNTVLVCCSLAMIAHLSGAALAQDAGSAADLMANIVDGHSGSAAPRSAPSRQTVVPLTSRFVLNGVTFDYGATGFLSAGTLNGTRRSPSLDLAGTYALESNLDEGVEGTLFRRRQSGWYLQLQSTDRRRTITTRREEAVDLHGLRVQVTVTGGCIAPDADLGALCTYTPGLEVDPAGVDPDTLVPGRFIINSQFGQPITSETHEALKAPSFQRGVEGGAELVGLDLDLPYAGFALSADRSDANDIDRYEDVEQRALLTLSRVEQNLYSNDSGAALDRTIRSFTLLDSDEWTKSALVVQAAAWLLPAFDAQLPVGAGDPNLRISNNLFLSANNLRLPGDSIATYQSGVSWVTHALAPARSASETPVAWSNSLWLGFSQARDTARSSHVTFEPTGPRTNLTSEFVQGGLDIAWDDLIDGRVSVIDEIDQQITEIDFSDISDVFVQAGIDVTTQEATRRVISQEISDYHYVPHLSFTGNRTSGTSVLRYYTGLILSDDINAYVGGDYALTTEEGWSSYLRADLYSHPDLDHSSEVEGRLSRRFTLATESRLTLGVAGHAALDQPKPDGSVPRLGNNSNGIDGVVGYESGPMEITMRQRFSDVGTDASASSTTFGVTYRVTPQLTLMAEHTPTSTEASYIRSRAGLTLSLGDEPDAPELRIQWAHAKYDYGQDAVGQRIGTSENIFLAAVQMRF